MQYAWAQEPLRVRADMAGPDFPAARGREPAHSLRSVLTALGRGSSTTTGMAISTEHASADGEGSIRSYGGPDCPAREGIVLSARSTDSEMPERSGLARTLRTTANARA